MQALAIVIDSFSDVELLCDLLEASRKRNVSVHLLLDHLNLDLFVSVWRDLKLDSKNFPVGRCGSFISHFNLHPLDKMIRPGFSSHTFTASLFSLRLPKYNLRGETCTNSKPQSERNT